MHRSTNRPHLEELIAQSCRCGRRSAPRRRHRPLALRLATGIVMAFASAGLVALVSAGTGCGLETAGTCASLAWVAGFLCGTLG
jgi:hypothetical protein